MGIARRPVGGLGDFQLPALFVRAGLHIQYFFHTCNDPARTAGGADCNFDPGGGVFFSRMRHLHVERRGVVGNFRFDENVLYIHRTGCDQPNGLPDTAGNRASPLRGFHRSYAVDLLILQQDRADDAQDQSVFGARFDQAVDAKLKRRKTALVNAHCLVVDPDFGQEVHRVKVQLDDLPFPTCRNLERATVERYTFIIFFDQLPATGHGDLASVGLRGENLLLMPSAPATNVFGIKDDFPSSIQRLYLPAIASHFGRGTGPGQQEQANDCKNSTNTDVSFNFHLTFFLQIRTVKTGLSGLYVLYTIKIQFVCHVLRGKCPTSFFQSSAEAITELKLI